MESARCIDIEEQSFSTIAAFYFYLLLTRLLDQKEWRFHRYIVYSEFTVRQWFFLEHLQPKLIHQWDQIDTNDQQPLPPEGLHHKDTFPFASWSHAIFEEWS